MKARLPHNSDPTGALRPFEMQNMSESTCRVYSFTSTPQAMAALKMRAPSMCSFRPCFPVMANRAATSSGDHADPLLLLWVFSMHTRLSRGKWGLAGRMSSSSCSGRMTPYSPRTGRTARPATLAKAPHSQLYMWANSSMITSSPIWVWASSALVLPMVPEGT